MKYKQMHFISNVLLMLSLLLLNNVFAQSSKGSETILEGDPAKIVATVNGQPITLIELNHAAGGAVTNIENPQEKSFALSQVLNELISQTLLEQEFKKNYPNNDANNKWKIDFATREGMASFYLEGQLNRLPKLDQKVLNEFILNNPQFTVNRKTYHFHQVVVDPGIKSTLPELKKLIDKGTTLEGLMVWLKQQNIPYIYGNLWRSSEQIPPPTLDTLNRLSKNAIDMTMTENNKQIVILKLLESYPDPTDIENARVGLMRGYQDELRSKAAQTVVKDLRATAVVEVMSPDLSVPAGIKESTVARDLTVSKDLNVVKDVPQGSLFKQLSVIWFFAVLILAPVATFTTYRGLRQANSIEKTLINKYDLLYPLKTKPYRFILVAFIPLVSFFIFPLYRILESPPIWLTFNVLIRLFVIGLFSGAMVTLACYLIPWLRTSFKKIGRALIILVCVHTFMVVAMFLGKL